MRILDDMTNREKNLWVELVVDVVVALYYFPKMLALLLAGEAALTGEAMAGLVMTTVMVGIAAGIVAGIVFRLDRQLESVDERDHAFLARGNLLAYCALVSFVVLIIGQVVISEMIPGFFETRMPHLNSIAVAHLLLLALVFSSMIKAVTQLFFYRRGY